MNHLDKYKNISVLGAAGKMGSGILLLNVLHSARLMHHPDYFRQTFVIHAIDQSFERLEGLNEYLRTQVLKWAEKHIVDLRKVYINRPHLIDNKDVIQTFVNEATALVKPSVNIESSYDSTLIFEAIIEDEQIKASTLKKINDNNPNKPFFLSNTSAIPIQVLNDRAGLEGRIIGCHFYNPPAVQKLIEVVELDNGLPALLQLVTGFAKQMGKVIVPSHDVAGFVGNGFFMREIQYAEHVSKTLEQEHSSAMALLITNRIVRKILVRPMGIYQLIDYVGIEVCALIMKVMDNYLKESMQSELLDQFLQRGIKGGQYPDGSQRDGIFKYEKGLPVEVYDLSKAAYVSVKSLSDAADDYIGVQTKAYSWSQLNRSKYKDQHLKEYFSGLLKEEGKGADLARDYLLAMKKIGLELQASGVTDTHQHVNTVMEKGFFHLYGPVNDFI